MISERKPLSCLFFLFEIEAFECFKLFAVHWTVAVVGYR